MTMVQPHCMWLSLAAKAELEQTFDATPCTVMEQCTVDAVNGLMATLADSSGKGVKRVVPVAHLRPPPPTVVLPDLLQPCMAVDARLEADSNRLWACAVVQQHAPGSVLVLEYGECMAAVLLPCCALLQFPSGAPLTPLLPVLLMLLGSLSYHTVPRASLRLSQAYDPASGAWAPREVPLVCRCLIDQTCGHALTLVRHRRGRGRQQQPQTGLHNVHALWVVTSA